MLAYSGRGRFVIQPLNLSGLVREMGHLLQTAIQKAITLKYDFAEDLPAVLGDANELRQVIMNLITNAAEAIGDEMGVITVRTGLLEADRQYLTTTYLAQDEAAGTYVCLEVSDTGCGMDEETKARIFDPFFTTKFTGRGLGLAAVLGIVRGHRGAIKIYSEPGRGTTFKVLLPCSEQFGCGGYGRCLTCPPHSPTPERTRRMLDEYRAAYVIWWGKDSPDRETLGEIEREVFLQGHWRAFMFACGPCGLCSPCPLEYPCRHPRAARPAMEASGIDVYETAHRAGLPIEVVTCHEDVPNFYSLLMVR